MNKISYGKNVYDKEEISYEFLADKNAIFNFIASNN